MSNPTIPADGDAMPAGGHKRPDNLVILEAHEQARNLIIAASNLSATDDFMPDALHAVICAAEEQLDIAIGAFDRVLAQFEEAAHV